MKKQSLAGIGLVFFFSACSSGGSGASGSGGASSNGSGGTSSSSGGSTSSSGGSTSSSSGGSTSSSGGHPSSGGTSGNASGGTTSPGTGGGNSSSSGGTSSPGTGGGGTETGTGGSTSPGSGGSTSPGSGGGTSPGSGGSSQPSMVLVTSSSSGYWQTGTATDASGSATVTVNDGSAAQKWEGFGGAFNERGWMYLTSDDMKTQALTLLFDSTAGAGFTWGRIPMGASDYAINRYTCDDTGQDPAATSSGSNRPAADTSMANFTLDQDNKYLIPYIQAAQKVNPGLRFWASPWTPPVWMKTGYKTDDGNGGTVKKPSYFDGGTVTNSSDNFKAYAQYYTKFVQGYMAKNIKIELVSPQNEPGYDQNYPSALWDKATYVAWVGQYLGPAMKTINVNVMLGTLSNYMDNGHADLDIASAVLADSTAKGFVTVAGVQWGVLDQIVKGTTIGSLPIWATEHKCGNYPWNPSGYPKYNTSQAPNDQAYGVESWGYIRDAITKGKVTSYSAWNMILDKGGLGNDTSRDWKQDTLLVADSGKITATPAYYVFRHVAQYVVPGAMVVGTSGGDAVAFKNPDGSVVAAMYNSGSANSSYVVSIGGKKLQFAMPAQGWATVKVTP